MVTVILVLQVGVAAGGHAIRLENRQDPGADTRPPLPRVPKK